MLRKSLLMMSLALGGLAFAADASATPINGATADNMCKGKWKPGKTTCKKCRNCTWCTTNMLGVTRCYWIGCEGDSCDYIVVRKKPTTPYRRPITQ